MSILAKIQQQNAAPSGKKMFAIVLGQRTSGKTTIAGTLPGKSLLLQAAVLESGNESAKVLAKQLKNDLVAHSFETLTELRSILTELEQDTVFDNVYVDGLGAITEMKAAEPAVIAAAKRDVWASYREIANDATEFLLKAKALTYPSKVKKAKNVFVTAALDVMTDPNGMPIGVELVAKGRVATSMATKLGEAVLTVVQVQGEKGPERKIITRTQGVMPGRIDSILDSANPGMVEANLATVLNLVR